VEIRPHLIKELAAVLIYRQHLKQYGQLDHSIDVVIAKKMCKNKTLNLLLLLQQYKVHTTHDDVEYMIKIDFYVVKKYIHVCGCSAYVLNIGSTEYN